MHLKLIFGEVSAVLVLDANDVRFLLPMADAISSNKKAFCLYSEGETKVPVRISFGITADNSSQFMPAHVKGDVNCVGIKIVSTFPSNLSKCLPVVTAQVLLLDPQTGDVSAMLNGTELTRIRTGAISGAAIDILARKDASIGALFGTGGQADSQLEAMLVARKLDQVRVYDQDRDKSTSFIKRTEGLAGRFQCKLHLAESPDEAINDADIITTVTTSKNPVFDGNKVKPGAHVTGVGSYTPNARELDFSLIERSRVFVDNKEAVFSEAGDFIIPIGEKIYSKDRIAGELGDVLLGRVQGRQNEEQITVMKTVGFAVLDVVAAWTIHSRALERGMGKTVEN